jgi:heptaprenyl diphosphate synthase
MAKLGTAMGLAFQMVDDLLDILGPEEKIGKPVGSDLRAGIPSLPVVLGVERSAELRSLFQNGTQMEGAAFDRALDLLRDPEIIATTRRLAADQVAIARSILNELEPSAYREGLATLIDEQTFREV